MTPPGTYASTSTHALLQQSPRARGDDFGVHAAAGRGPTVLSPHMTPPNLHEDSYDPQVDGQSSTCCPSAFWVPLLLSLGLYLSYCWYGYVAVALLVEFTATVYGGCVAQESAAPLAYLLLLLVPSALLAVPRVRAFIDRRFSLIFLLSLMGPCAYYATRHADRAWLLGLGLICVVTPFAHALFWQRRVRCCHALQPHCCPHMGLHGRSLLTPLCALLCCA